MVMMDEKLYVGFI